MAYYIGQFRKPQLDSYYNNYDFENLSMDEPTNYSVSLNNNVYTNKYITLSEGLERGKCYYLKFTVSLKDLGADPTRNITVKLSQTRASESNTQILNLKNGLAIGTNETVVETTFIPNFNYQFILFQITRKSEDNRVTNSNNSKGALFNTLTINSFILLPNTIDILKNMNNSTFYQNIKYFKKIGIQAPTGFQFNIDGLNIRIGNSGIYLINNGYNIKAVYFWPTLDKYFIMDFEY